MWGPMPGSGTELIATEERGITPRVFEQLFARIQQVCVILHLKYCMLCIQAVSYLSFMQEIAFN